VFNQRLCETLDVRRGERRLVADAQNLRQHRRARSPDRIDAAHRIETLRQTIRGSPEFDGDGHISSKGIGENGRSTNAGGRRDDRDIHV
jgi:hypothetical protein